MKRLPDEVVNFFQNQGCVIVSTIDKNGFPYSACKGIVDIDHRGRIYLLDLYSGRTHKNLKDNPKMSIAAVDEHKFMGYCLKGKAKVVPREKMRPHLIQAWEERITSRITQRVLKNIREEKGQARHPEALLPKPEHLIVMEVEEVVDLTPHHLK